MATKQHIEDFFEDKARSGDGQYAIAFALLDLNQTQKKVATALERLGSNNATTEMGAVEMLSAEVKGVAEAVGLLCAQLQR
jgi:aminoglycoside phosphotransferase family enzyme